MRITFFSNFLNHHQLPFCLEMKKRLGDNFKFVATEEIPEERLNLGYDDMNKKYDFVVRSYEDEDIAYKLGLESDVVIIGSAPKKYIKERIKNKKLTFRYSERVLRNGFNLRIWLSLIKNYTIKERENVYLLCSSAYTARDYNLAGAYVGKSYKWGYFPEVKEYDINKLLEMKKNKVVKIIWVARFLKLKHPEKVVEVARRLKEENISFSIEMIGNGEEFEKTKETIKDLNLTKDIKLLGSINNKEVRKHMEEADIFLFTSDFNEGWGAVLNEAMNSGCAVVASHAIGATGFLIKHNVNGLVYNDSSFEDLYNKTKELILNKEKRENLGINAYNTMNKYWNASNATKQLINLSKMLLKEKNSKEVFPTLVGPCSKAKFIPEHKMYKYLIDGGSCNEN